MNTPHGYNPIGESAPGLPRHDAPLPGHVPGQYTPADPQQTQQQAWSPNVGYRDPGFSPGFGRWSGRVIMACAIYLTLPVQMALYPVAGAVALAVGLVAYAALAGSGMGYDDVMSWCWSIAFAALTPMMRVETGIESRFPAYPKLRHWLRLVLVAGSMYYFGVHQQLDTPPVAAITGLIVAAVVHFVLRIKLAKGMWHAFQAMLWLRKA